MGLKSVAVQLGWVHQACVVHHGESTWSLEIALGILKMLSTPLTSLC